MTIPFTAYQCGGVLQTQPPVFLAHPGCRRLAVSGQPYPPIHGLMVQQAVGRLGFGQPAASQRDALRRLGGQVVHQPDQPFCQLQITQRRTR
ncbi:MAG: hypothetical protein LUO80_04270 [Methylococcaceae bacterium]|nr:hypothetical protein [Methylococcaceae bacterium]